MKHDKAKIIEKIIRQCAFCAKDFVLNPYQVLNPRKLTKFYCSKKCVNKSRIGEKWSDEQKSKYIPYWKGKKLSSKIKNKISKTRLQRIKEGKIIPVAGMKGKKHSKETKTHLSKKMSLSYEERYGDRAELERIKRSLTHKKRFEALGLPHKSNRLIDYNYRKWRKAVLKRDNYECQLCKSKEKLECDHLKSWVLFPKLRYEVSNGRVLCKTCHTKTPNFGFKALKNLFYEKSKQI